MISVTGQFRFGSGKTAMFVISVHVVEEDDTQVLILDPRVGSEINIKYKSVCVG